MEQTTRAGQAIAALCIALRRACGGGARALAGAQQRMTRNPAAAGSA